MKKIYKLAPIAASILMMMSCDKVLNIDPTDRFSPAAVWANETSVDKYVYGFYGFLKESSEIYNSNMANFTDAYSDIIKASSWDQYGHRYNKTLLESSFINSDDAGPFSCWTGDAGCYNRIRRQNEFLRDAPNYVGKFGENFIKVRSAEVRFIRAFAYYRLIRVYGGVVIRTNVDGPDQNDKARVSEAESWAQVIEDLKFAGENLPASWDNNGRITKAAAYGMLSRAALYAKEWNLVTEAADSCAKYGGKLSMEANGGYAGVFASRTNPENLLTIAFLPGYASQGASHRADVFFRPVGDGKYHNNSSVFGAFGPTSELVDSYEMADGTEFSWATHGTDPYAGREPRFYASILYNGADWEGRKIDTSVGGEDGISDFKTQGTAPSSVTGYYLKKWVTEDDKTWAKNGSSHFAIMLRFAEVLLNKAEAYAELGDLTKALECLNEVRSRVGLPAKTTADTAEFMKFLRHERMVELAGEGFRLWDLRRWKLADGENGYIDGKQAHGVKITKDAGSGALTYSQVEVDAGMKRLFYNRFYLFSLPVVERSNNKLLGENNPGW